MNENVREVYCFLANNYEDGDEIFFFGFSRCAYIVRAVSGLIGNLGLLGKGGIESFPEIYEQFQLRRTTPESHASWDKYVEDEHLALLREPHVKIKVLGYWDTVGNLGLPEYWLVKQLRMNEKYQFHDTQLSAGECCYTIF